MLVQIASPISINAGPFAGGSVVISELEYEKFPAAVKAANARRPLAAKSANQPERAAGTRM
jgi:hypothetical protein